MRRASIALLAALCLTFASCSTPDANEAATTTPPPSASTATAPPTTSSPESSTTTTQTPTTTQTAAPPTTTTTSTTTLPPVADVATGLFCRDLNALGYDYTGAVTYWVREGSPDRMDADRNGIPCETVYPAADVVAFWGDPLPTTTAAPLLTLAGLEAYVGEQWRAAAGYPIDWECQLEHGSRLSAGAVATCRPRVIGEGQFPILTALVLDSSGTVSVAQSGVYYTELMPDYLMDIMGPGKFCRDVLDLETGLPEWMGPEVRHFGAVLYWFMEGRPDRMDADVNGIPCETLVDAGVIAAFWDGGLVGDTW